VITITGSGQGGEPRFRGGPYTWPVLGNTSGYDQYINHNLGTKSVRVVINWDVGGQPPNNYNFRDWGQGTQHRYGYELLNFTDNQILLRLRRWSSVAEDYYVDIYGYEDAGFTN
jgi:hypothetical protein